MRGSNMTRISEEHRFCLIFWLNLSSSVCDESDLSLLACTAADSLHGGWEGAETASDGFGCSDEEQRLPVYRPVLRSPVQRGDTNTPLFSVFEGLFLCLLLLTVLFLCLSSGRLLDMYGTNVYLPRQILQICILCIRWCDSRGNIRKNYISSKSRISYINKSLCVVVVIIIIFLL